MRSAIIAHPQSTAVRCPGARPSEIEIHPRVGVVVNAVVSGLDANARELSGGGARAIATRFVRAPAGDPDVPQV